MSAKYEKKVIGFSVVVMLFMGLVNTELGIISQMTHQNGNNWAGALLTGLFFLGSGLGSIYNSYIGKYQYRFCIFTGSLGSTVYIVLGLIFIKVGFSVQTLVINETCSFIFGLLVSVFYNSIYNFVNLLGKLDKK